MKSVNFGATGKTVSLVGLGGEGVLRTFNREKEAQAVIRAAIEQGITYFDSARVYSDSEVYYGSIWKKESSLRKSIFQTSKSASRNKDGALADLKGSLKRLQTDYLDLWQIHDVRTEEDLQAISRPGGALEAFVEARDKGIVRFIGVTGHHDPYILTRAVEELPVDSVLLPVNPVEEILSGFLTHTLPAAKKKGIAVIGMKVLGGSHYVLPKLNITPEALIRYALSLGITLPIVGCSSPEEVQTLSSAATDEGPFSERDRKILVEKFRPYASKMAFYRGVR
ncbi:MAG: aldo/keto reductase [Desulfobulbaceae bacterium]|nr:aldo/keto reductase [Desulfobulbaceae bacterium]